MTYASLLAYPWLQVDQHRPWDIVLIVRLVEKDILPVISLCIDGIFLENALLVDPMFLAKLLPELNTDYVALLVVLWLPHCPA
jgi:hypothetical protein